jgi:hypothetical protein
MLAIRFIIKKNEARTFASFQLSCASAVTVIGKYMTIHNGREIKDTSSTSSNNNAATQQQTT